MSTTNYGSPKGLSGDETRELIKDQYRETTTEMALAMSKSEDPKEQVSLVARRSGDAILWLKSKGLHDEFIEWRKQATERCDRLWSEQNPADAKQLEADIQAIIDSSVQDVVTKGRKRGLPN